MDLVLKALNLNLPAWQLNLLDVLQKSTESGNQVRVFHHPRCPGKSWIQRWLNENASHSLRLKERNSVLLPPTTKEDISTLAQKNRPNISVGKTRNDLVIYVDEMDYPVNEELVEKLNEITRLMKTSVAQTPKSEYNIYINSELRKENEISGRNVYSDRIREWLLSGD